MGDHCRDEHRDDHWDERKPGQKTDRYQNRTEKFRKNGKLKRNRGAESDRIAEFGEVAGEVGNLGPAMCQQHQRRANSKQCERQIFGDFSCGEKKLLHFL